MEHQSVATYDFSVQCRIKKTETVLFNPVADPLRCGWNDQTFNIEVTKSLEVKSVWQLFWRTIWIMVIRREIERKSNTAEQKNLHENHQWTINNIRKDANMDLTDSIATISFLHIPLHLYWSLVAMKGISASFVPWILRVKVNEILKLKSMRTWRCKRRNLKDATEIISSSFSKRAV